MLLICGANTSGRWLKAWLSSLAQNWDSRTQIRQFTTVRDFCSRGSASLFWLHRHCTLVYISPPQRKHTIKKKNLRKKLVGWIWGVNVHWNLCSPEVLKVWLRISNVMGRGFVYFPDFWPRRLLETTGNSLPFVRLCIPWERVLSHQFCAAGMHSVLLFIGERTGIRFSWAPGSQQPFFCTAAAARAQASILCKGK